MEELDPPPGPAQTSGFAITSLVLGLLGLSCACFTGLPAIIFGHLARGQIRRSQGAVTGDGIAVAGLVLGYVTTLLIGGFFMAGLMIPTIMGARTRADRTVCLTQVRAICEACEEYARDHGGEYPASFDLLQPYLRDPEALRCPSAEEWESRISYEIVFSGTNPDAGAVLIQETQARHESKRAYGYVDLTVEMAK